MAAGAHRCELGCQPKTQHVSARKISRTHRVCELDHPGCDAHFLIVRFGSGNSSWQGTAQVPERQLVSGLE